jgi:Uma2 family endonuclease
MTIAVIEPVDYAIEISLRPLPALSEQDFVALCQANPDLRLERTSEGNIVIMAPEGGESGRASAVVLSQIEGWSAADGAGLVFGSSTGFRLPNGATRSPDVAWVRLERLSALTPEEKRAFLPLCPDFVVELRSPTDRLASLQAKLEEYVANGACLGWLIDPGARAVWVYRPSGLVECLEGVVHVVGDPDLPGLVLDLSRVWEPGF